jgi:hypothetical protein
MAQDFPQLIGSYPLFPLTCSTHITSNRHRLGVFAVVALNTFVVFLFTLADGRVQRLMSSHSRPTVDMARVDWRRAIQK